MMRRMARSAAVILAAGVLAGCENDAASYQIDGSREHAITLIREQRYFWSPESDVAVVVANAPQCQRRYALNRTPVDNAPAKLFQTADGDFLLQNGQNWYAIATGACELQQVEAPAGMVPGTPLGAFDRAGGRLRFMASAQPKG